MTEATTFNDADFPSTVERGLIGRFVWDSGNIGYHLEDGDFDDNGRNDWDENGARQAMELAFDLWANVADLNFFETTRSRANLVERISDTGGEDEDGQITLGFHYFPGGNGGGGLRSQDQSDGEYNLEARGWSAAGLTQGGSAFSTIVHEIGHALGLEHPFDDDLFSGSSGEQFGEYANFGLNQGIYSVMTYNRGWVGLGGRSPSEGYGHTGTPLALDIAAVQAIYGANDTHALGDDTYTLADTDGRGTFFGSIWDAGGNDTLAYDGALDANVFLDEATIDDTPTGGGLLSYVDGVRGGTTIARGAVIENGRTGSGDDVLGGNGADNVLEAGAGDDIVFGLNGSDMIMGGAGDDILIGDYESVETFGLALTDAPPPYFGPSLPDGLGQGSGLIRVETNQGNTSTSRALDISDEFALRSRMNIEQSEELYSESVSVRAGAGFGYYALDLDAEGRITIDIDGGFETDASGEQVFNSFDSWVQILDRNGNLIAENDDRVSGDIGSQATSRGRNIDSYLDLTLDAGTYYVKVGAYSPDGPVALNFGATYTMHVIADAYVGATPPTLPEEGGFAQVGYYYETPDFADAIGGFNRGGSGSRDDIQLTDKDGNPGHWHPTEDGGRVWHATGHDDANGHSAEGHGDGCGCAGCAGEDAFDPVAAEDAGTFAGMTSVLDARFGPDAPVFDGFVLALEGGWEVA